jgi:hypothetical protein
MGLHVRMNLNEKNFSFKSVLQRPLRLKEEHFAIVGSKHV